MTDQLFYNRRKFIATAAIAVGGAQFGPIATAAANGMAPYIPQANSAVMTQPWKIKLVKAGPLQVEYAEAGPKKGEVIVLLHGWPYDIWSFGEVVPLLIAKGYRILMPRARGFGNTNFLSSQTPRNAQQGALASDVIDFMNALEIPSAIIGGFDWGARSAAIVAAVWPERCRALIAVSGYIVVDRIANRKPLNPSAELGWWYQYYFSTQRGAAGYRENTYEFNKLIWKLASPKWDFTEQTYSQSAAAFNHPDHAAIVLHNYRWRLELAEGEPAYQGIEEQLTPETIIQVPSITIGSDFDGVAADGLRYRKRFTGKYEHRRLDGIGHNVPQEAPIAFAEAVLAAAEMSNTKS
jgi:pimeloyl-ACP methyl ester carboxylesterase